MKKLMIFSAAAALALVSPALAQEGEKSPHRGGMMEKMDSDSDGMVSKAEFMAFHEKRFAEMDANSDGKISKEEIDAKKAEWKAKRMEMKMHKEGAVSPPAAEPPPADAPPADAPAEAQ